MIICPNCQNSNEEGSGACIYCGHTLERKRSWWRRILNGLFNVEGYGLEIATSLAPTADDSSASLSRGNDYFKQRRYQRAIGAYTEAINHNAHYPGAYYNRGLAYSGLGLYWEAIQDYDEAIRIDHQYVLAYGNRALTYALLGNHPEAEQDAKRAVELGIDAAIWEEIEKMKNWRAP